jgi:branched-chain amino acid transport system substrate-binding protein
MRTLSAILLLCIFISTGSAEDRIRIGISTPLSGDAATYGTDIRNVFEYANKILTNDRYELIFEDDRCDGKTAVSVAHKLVSLHKVRYALGVVCSGALAAAAPIYDKAGVIVITPTANLDSISSAGKNTFTTIPSNTKAMKPLSKYLCSHHSRIGVLSEPTDMAQQMATSFYKNCSHIGSKVFLEDFQPKDHDIRSQISRMSQRGIEAIFVNSQTEATFISILRQVRVLDRVIPIYGALFPGTFEFREKAGPLAEGIRYVDLPDIESALTPKAGAEYRQFILKYGQMKSIRFLYAIAFEAFRSLHLAIQSKKPASEYLRTALSKGC